MAPRRGQLPDDVQASPTDKAVRRLALAYNRETTWVDVAEILGPDRKTPDGEPWKLLMITDLSWTEWDHFQSLTDYAEICATANRYLLLHNGWEIGGKLVPQPGDRMVVKYGKPVYEPAMRVVPADELDSEDGHTVRVEKSVPITDDAGEPLWRISVPQVEQEAEAAFFRTIPSKLVGWCMGEAWRRSQLLPNLTRNESATISLLPTTNGNSES